MKKLALLFLAVIPLAACQTSPPSQRQLAQAREANDACDAGDQPHLSCVNTYLETHYGWRVQVFADGSFHATPPSPGHSYETPNGPIYSAAGFGNDDSGYPSSQGLYGGR
jgi:hypothetical protein